MARKTSYIPTSYRPISYDNFRAIVGNDLEDTIRKSQIGPAELTRRYGGAVRAWSDLRNGDYEIHGIDRLIACAQALGIEYTVERA